MTKILTALAFAVALGLSLSTASAESQGGQTSLNDQALPVVAQHG